MDLQVRFEDAMYVFEDPFTRSSNRTEATKLVNGVGKHWVLQAGYAIASGPLSPGCLNQVLRTVMLDETKSA